MRKISLLLIAIFTLAALLSACSSNDGFVLADTSWKLTSYGAVGSQTPAVDGIDTRLEFGTDGTVSGTMGCNRFSGTYSQKDDTITFGPIAATEMACPDAQMAQESAAFQVLAGTVKFERGDGTMTITSADGMMKQVLEGLMKAN